MPCAVIKTHSKVDLKMNSKKIDMVPNYSNINIPGTWRYKAKMFAAAILMLLTVSLSAQTVNQAEYFFDTDPGVGLATGIGTGSPDDSISVSTSVSTVGLAPGNHFLFVRTKNAGSQWSLHEGRMFIIKPKIVAAEYFIDVEPGVGNGIALAVPTSEDSISFSTSIATGNLTGGWHVLFVRTRDDMGRWSLYEGRNFFVKSTIIAAEYFIDADPGVGNGTAFSVTASEDSIAVSTNIITPNLSGGWHTLYVRALNNSGVWSLYEGRRFFVKPSIIAAEYFVDKDPGVGNGTPIPVTAGEDSIVVSAGVIPTCIDSGRHFLYIRTLNSNNTWSLFEPDTFYMTTPAPVITANGSNTICTGDSVTLSVNTGAGCSYQWYRNNAPIAVNGNNATYNANIGGSYYLVITNTGINYTSNTINITLGGNGAPPSITAGGPTTFCASDSVQLTAMPNAQQSYLWSTGATTQSIYALAAGFYYVTVTDTTGCNAEANIQVFTNPNPVAIAYSNSTACETFNITLNATGGTSYAWSGPAFSSAQQNPVISNATLAATGTYTVTVTDANNCTDTDTAQLFVYGAPIVNAGNNGPYCQGTTIHLSATGANTYAWSGPAFSSNLQSPNITGATPANGGVYTVTGTDNHGCTASNTTTVVVNGAVATITPSGPTSFCTGGNVDLTASGGTTYLWSNGSTNATITVSASGTYTVTITTALGCTASTSQSVTVNPIPTATAGHTSPVCEGGSVTLQATGGSSYAWSGPSFSSTQQNPVLTGLNNTMDGTYTVTVTASGCTATASTSVTVNANPTAAASNGGPYCVGTNIQLNATGGTSYSWSGPTFSSGTQNPVRNNAQLSYAGAYTVTVTDGNGCTASDVTTVAVSGFNASITSSGATSFCAGGSVDLTAEPTGAYTYVWSNSSTNQTITANASGTYTVSVTDGACTVTASQSVTVNLNPTVTAGNTGPYCTGSIMQLTSSGTNIAGYAWGGPGGFSGNTPNPQLGNVQMANAGLYTVTVTSGAGCTATASTTVAVTGNSPVLAFTGNSGFTNHLVSPTQANPYATYRFEVKYSDADNNMPAFSYPRVVLDYEGNGVFNNTNDRTYYMQPVDINDTTVTDGKLYYYETTGLPVGLAWQTRVEAVDNSGLSCSRTFGVFNEPDVLDDADVSIFANDITFSVTHPDTSSPLTVNATVHNNSSFPAVSIVVHLRNQYDTLANYGDITIPYLAANSTTTVSWNITTPATPSWNPMQVFVDYTNVVNEPNELDNQAIRPFVNGNFILPGDIRVTANVGPLTSYAQPNNYVTVSGRATYRDTAVPLQDSSVAGAEVTVFVPSTGATYTTVTNSQGYYAQTFFTTVTPGLYSVNVGVDDFTLQGDTTAPFVLVTPPCATNLEAEVVLSAGTIYVGQSVTASYKVRNNGCADVNIQTASNWNWGVMGSGGQPISALISGAQQSVNIGTYQFNAAGTYTLCATADATSLINESNENNTDCRSVTVLNPTVDLVPVVLSGGAISFCNPNISLGVRVYNSGTISSPNNALGRVTVKKNNVIEAVYTQNLGSISGGYSNDYSFNFTLADTGTRTITFAVDTTLVVVETDETNNTSYGAITATTCIQKPDLTFVNTCSYSVTPDNPTYGDTVYITTTVQNIGNLAAGSTVDEVSAAGIITQYPRAAMGIGQPQSTTYAVAMAGVPTTLNVALDKFNTENEYDENNVFTTSLCYEFNLGQICTNVYGDDFWERGHVIGQPISFGAMLYNHGRFKANSVGVRYEVSGPGLPAGWNVIGTTLVSNVAYTCYCGYMASCPTTFAPPSTGTYYVRMIADYNGNYLECNDANNELVVSFNVTNNPDYRTLSQYIAPSLLNPEPGEPVSFDITYENIGASNVIDSLNVRLLMNDTLFGQVRTNGLVTGDDNTVHIPGTWSSNVVGIHIIRAIVDANNEIGESNEMNNEATRAIIVGQSPNLHFTQITPSDSTPSVGDTISFTVTVANDGDENATSDLYFYYLTDFNDTNQVRVINNFYSSANDDTTFSFNWVVADASTYIIGRIRNTVPGEYLYDDNEYSFKLGELQIDFNVSAETCIDDSNGVAIAHVSGGTPPYTYSWTNGSTDSTTTGTAGSYTLTVFDSEGNSGAGTTVISTIADNTYPLIFNMPNNITYVASNGVCPAPITWGMPSASDNCGIDSFYSNYQSGHAFPVGTTTVVYTAKDKAGNTATSFFTVQVIGAPLAFAGNDKTVCGTDTLQALNPAYGTGMWSVATGTATFTNAADAHTSVSNLTAGTNKLVWTVVNGTCGTSTDTVTITAPVEVCGNGIDDDCDGFTDEGCAGITLTWTGLTGTNWHANNNWSPNVVPTAADSVIIPLRPNQPVVNAPAAVRSLRASAANVIVNVTLGNVLTVNNNLVGNTNFKTIGDGYINLSAANGKISSIVIANNLRVSGTVTINAGGRVDIITELDIAAGTFNTNGLLYIKSNAAGTGRIAPILSGVINGNVTQERYIPAGPLGYEYLAAAVTGQTIQSLRDDITVTFGTPSSVQWYNETLPGNATTSGWSNFTGAANPIVNYRGVAAYMFAKPKTVDFTGAIFQGNQTVPLSYTNSGMPTEDGYHLMANPYISPIDWDAATGWVKNNIAPTIYILNPATNNNVSYNSATNIGTGGFDGKVASGQSFFVQSTAPGAVLGFSESVKTTTGTFYKTSETTNTYFRMKLQGESGNGDEMVLGFDDNATDGFEDQLDAPKIASGNVDMAIVTPTGEQLSQQFIANPTATKIIPLALNTNSETGNYTLAFEDVSNINRTDVYLRDNFTGSVVNISDVPAYTFTVTQQSSTKGTHRFDLVIGGENNRIAMAMNVYPNPANNMVNVSVTGADEAAELAVYDVVGNLVYNQKEIKNTGYTIDLSTLESGIYFVRLTDGKGTIAQRLIISK
jgi:hypothetical protein